MKVGIFGGGQLGCLLAEAIVDLGGEVAFYDEDPEAPAVRRYQGSTVAPFADAEATAAFARGCDVLTYEFENIDARPLRALGERVPIAPSITVLETTQDRALEKTFLRDHGLPHVRFVVVPGLDAVTEAAARFGYPFVLKTTRGGYDGKGQRMIDGPAALEAALASWQNVPAIQNQPLVLEERIDLVAEVSCLVGRDAAGNEVVFPVLENTHEGHVLDFTVLPARVAPEVVEVVQDVALRTARALGLVGLLTTEFFLGRRGGSTGIATGDVVVYVNELAPRPHNSGHVTRNACFVSQYDVLARVLLGLPLAPPTMHGPGTYCMGNLLGEVFLSQGNIRHLDLSAWQAFPDVVDVVLYGKQQAKPRRKMGHFVTWAADAETAVSRARAFREAVAATRTPLCVAGPRGTE